MVKIKKTANLSSQGNSLIKSEYWIIVTKARSTHKKYIKIFKYIIKISFLFFTFYLLLLYQKKIMLSKYLTLPKILSIIFLVLEVIT